MHTVTGTLATIEVYSDARVHLSTALLCNVLEGADPTSKYVHCESSGCADLLEAPPPRLYGSPFAFYLPQGQSNAGVAVALVQGVG